MIDKVYQYIQGTNIHGVERIDLKEPGSTCGDVHTRMISIYTAGGRIDITLFAENLSNLDIIKEIKI